MPLELRPDGTVAGFDSLDQLLEARRRMIEQDQAMLRKPKDTATTKADPIETESLGAEAREMGMRLIRAIAGAGGKMSSSKLAEALSLQEARGLALFTRAARVILGEKLAPKQVDHALYKARDRQNGTVWTLDVNKLKEVGLL